MRAARNGRVEEKRRLAPAAVAPVKRERGNAGFADTESPTARAVPFLVAGLFGAVFLLGLALIPARAVPWPRALRAVDDRREELAFFGALGLLATGLFYVLAVLAT